MKVKGHLSAKEHIPMDIKMSIGKYIELSDEYYHDHEFLEIQYVLFGTGKQIIEDKEYSVSTGDISFTNFFTKHCFVSENPEQPLQVFNLLFFPEYFEGTVNCEENGIPYKKAFMLPYFTLHDENNVIYNVLDAIYNEYKMAMPHYENTIKGYFIAMQNIIERLYDKQINDNNRLIAFDSSINKALIYIEKHFREKIYIDDLAKAACLSPSYLCSKFKETTYITIKRYIYKRRVREVCRLLRETTQSFGDIALDVGCTNANYLRNVFKMETGKTPLEFRNEYKSKVENVRKRT